MRGPPGNGDPASGKSEQVAVAISLCVVQSLPVLLIASRHEAVDACLTKVETIVRKSGIEGVNVRVFDVAEDRAACKRIFRNGDEWCNTEFRVRSKWRPHLSVEFGVRYFLGLEPSAWSGRRVDATTSPQCVQNFQHVTQQLNDAPDDLPDAANSRLHTTFSVHVDQCNDHVYQSALPIAATPYSVFGKTAKGLARSRTSGFAVDEAAAIDEAHVLQCVYNQSIFLFAFDHQQLPTFSASKTSPMVPWVSIYEKQYVCSLAERLVTLEWPIIIMDQQLRMLPGLFDPARKAFYSKRDIEDVMPPGADTSIAHTVEIWVMAQGGSPPPLGKYWPLVANIPNTECDKVQTSKSSMNKEMWDIFFEKALWPDFLSPKAGLRVDWGRICIITPYRAVTNYIQGSLYERGLDLATSRQGPQGQTGLGSGPDPDENLAETLGALILAEDVDDSTGPDGPEPTIRTHNPITIDCATIDSYQGQEKDLVFCSSTASAWSGPKFVANSNRLCVVYEVGLASSDRVAVEYPFESSHLHRH